MEHTYLMEVEVRRRVPAKETHKKLMDNTKNRAGRYPKIYMGKLFLEISPKPKAELIHVLSRI